MQQIIQENPREEKKKSATSIPIRAYFMACARNWYWFVISVILFGCIAYLYSKSQPLRYSANALILVQTKDSNQGTQSQTFSDLGISTGVNFIPNERYKIRSTKLMENVVNTLGANIQYYGHVFLRDVSLYKDTPLQVTPLRQVTQGFTVTVVPKGGDDLEFKVDGDGGWKKAHFGNKVNTKYGPIAITKTKNFKPEGHIDYKVIVRISTPESMARQLVGSLAAESADKQSDVVKLTLSGDNYEQCVDVLNAVIASYNQDAINDKNLVARSTEAFIADRVEALSKDLSGVDSQVAALKVNAAGSTIYADPTNVVRSASDAAEVGVQVALARNVYDYIGKMSSTDLIPGNTGIANSGVEGQIAQYNEMMLRYQKIASTSSSENPVMVDMSNQLTSMKGNIMRGLSNYINSLQMKQAQARSQQSMATGSIVAVPSQEKAITEVTRQQKIKEQLYLYLLNKREENALQLAITEPNAKIIESASGSSAPISPIPSRIMMMGLLLGLLLPALILYALFWYYSLDNRIHTRHDIEEMVDIPIIGELPRKKQHQADQEIVVTETGHDRITEAFRIIRSNLDFMLMGREGGEEQKGVAIQFTSTMSGEGKSFVAVNMALSLAHTGKKVIAVDLDLRKGRFSEYAGIDSVSNGASAYLSGKLSDLNQVVNKGVLGNANLDMIAVGAIPPNPTNLLMSDNFKRMIDDLKNSYDYVILDTVPYNIIADAGLINRYVDLTIYVIRDGKVDKRYLEDIDKMNRAKKIKNLTILINDINIEGKHYGYGAYGSYGYGGYGNYGYGYGYGYGSYDDDDKKA